MDDDRMLCAVIRDRLTSEQLEVVTRHTARDGLAACESGAMDVVILDQKLPDGDGHTLCAPVLRLQPATKIVFITAWPSFEDALAAVKSGAYDYLCKPFEMDALALAVSRCLDTVELERVKRLHQYRTSAEHERSTLAGGEALAGILGMIRLAARATSPVLITGETGTGKNLVARAIHFGGEHAVGPFIGLNCGALPDQLIEAELFGWERGAFTSAVASREGVLEMADGGSLLFDEIGAMPLHLQSKLLSVLEDRRVRRLGGRLVREVDFRVIAATNAQLEEAVAAGLFRPDLFYRLNVIRIHLPPLRERPSDIAALCEHLLQRLAPRGRRLELAEGELGRLTAYPWPGNVRELRNVLERAVVLHGDVLRPSSLLATTPRTTEAPVVGTEAWTLHAVERAHVRRVLRHHAGNLTRASRALGVSLSTLKRRLKAYGVADGSE